MRDPRTRDSRGFAFVTFTEVAAAEEAMNALNATTLDDKVITVEKAKRGRARTRKLSMLAIRQNSESLLSFADTLSLLECFSYSRTVSRRRGPT